MVVAAALCASGVAPARAPAPSPDCLDARAVERVRVLDENTLLIESGSGRFVLGHAAGCDAGTANRPSSLLAAEGWLCGGANEFVRSDTTLCPVSSVTRVDARVYASLAAAADGVRLAGDATRGVALAPVQVIGASPRSRGFGGDSDYCFAKRAVRGWNLEGGTLFVQTSPRRAGGNRRYRVELATSCPELDWADGVDFDSTVATGWICGRPGDRVIALNETGIAGAGPTDSVAFGQGGWTPAQHASMGGCAIAAVHPDED